MATKILVISQKRRELGPSNRLVTTSCTTNSGDLPRHLMKSFLICGFSLLAFFFTSTSYAQTKTIRTGSFIINMGNTNTASANDDLKPYGMLMDLMINYHVPISWVINPSKLKDGTDFTHNGVAYKGGTFIIPREYRTDPVDARIAYWQTQGVVGNFTVSPFEVNVTHRLTAPPHWVLNSENTAIPTSYLTAAGISAASFPGVISYKLAAALDCCDDIFAMPHADPCGRLITVYLRGTMNVKVQYMPVVMR